MSDLKSIQLARATYMEKVPSTDQKVQIRPFTVGDEKILLVASESKNTAQMADAVTQVVNRCMEPKPEKMESYDYEYLFLKIRAVSVGETSDLGIKCKKCNQPNQIKVNISEVQVVNETKHDGLIKFDDSLAFKMKIPTLKQTANANLADVDSIFNIIISCVETVFYNDDAIEIDDSNRGDLNSIVEQLSTNQFLKLRDFYESIPKVSKDIQFICGSCEHDNKLKLEGLASFF